MELQDRVTVTLTKHGAKILNKRNRMANKISHLNSARTDYKEGDLITSHFDVILDIFKNEFYVGNHKICFKNITPVQHPKDIFKSGTCKGRIVMKQPDESLHIALDKMIIRKFLEGFDCRIFNDVIAMGPVTIRATGEASRKEKDEFVSMTVYEMAINAFDSAMDEITRLRAKLARIQEVINEQ